MLEKMEISTHRTSIKGTLKRLLFIPLIFLLLFITFITFYSINQQIDSILLLQKNNNINLENTISLFFSRTEDQMRFFSHHLSMIPRELWSSQLSSIKQYYPEYHNFFILDKNGRILHREENSPENVNVKKLHAEDLLKTPVEQSVKFSDPYFSSIYNRIVLTSVYPITYNGETTFLAAVLCLQNLQFSVSMRTESKAFSFIMDENGSILAHPDEEWIRQNPDLGDLEIIKNITENNQRTFSHIFKGQISSGINSRRYIGSSLRMDNGWILVTAERLNSASEKLFYQTLLSLISILVFSIIFIIIQIRGLKEISSSIANLIDISGLIASGHYSPQTQLQAGYLEIETLRESLIHMAEAIRDRDLILEQRVEERTETLRILYALNQKMIDATGITELILSILTEIPALRTEAALFGRTETTSKGTYIDLQYLWYNGNRENLDSHPQITLEEKDMQENIFLQSSDPKFIKHIEVSQEVSSRLKDFFHQAHLSHLFLIPLEGREMGKAFIFFTGNGLLEFSYNEISLIKSIQKNLSIIIENRTLLKKLQDRAEELANARNKETRLKEQAVQANNSKNLFLANMSHELRTPLNSILGFSQILRRADNVSKDQKDHLDIILRSGEHLLSLINSILEISRIEANKISLESSIIHFLPFLDDIIKLFNPRIKKKKLSFDFHFASDLPEYIETDATKLRQILFNIIDNSIKYTEEGHISFSVKVKMKGSEDVLISFSVKDSGSGISTEDQEMIFRAFEQTNQTSTVGGVGLGLTITKQYVHILGGEISVSSKKNKGSEFSFYIKTKLPDKNEVLKEKKHEGIITGLEPNQPVYRILIAGEQNESFTLLNYTVSSVGLETYSVTDPEKVIESIEEYKPSLIWLNHSSEFNGLQICRKIINNNEEENQKIILYMENNTKRNLSQNDINTFDNIVTLPLSQEDILEKMSFNLGLRYTYSENKRASKAPSAELDIVLPEQTRNEFIMALKQGDLELIQKQVNSLKSIPKSTKEKLKEMTDEFRFHDIIDILTRNGS